MARYRVHGTVTISMSVIVEATSKADAIEKAKEADMMSLCWQCGGDTLEHRGEWRTSGEIDGEPRGLKAEPC